jgi:hypothetical protein
MAQKWKKVEVKREMHRRPFILNRYINKHIESGSVIYFDFVIRENNIK